MSNQSNNNKRIAKNTLLLYYYNKVKCKKIERMLPELSKMVIAELIHLS